MLCRLCNVRPWMFRRPRLLPHRSEVVTDVCARAPSRIGGVPFIVQVTHRPSFVPPVAQVLGGPSFLLLVTVLRPSTGSSAPRVTCPGTGSSKETNLKHFSLVLSSRSEDGCANRDSRLNAALVRKNEFLPVRFGWFLFHSYLCHMSCLCPPSSHSCSHSAGSLRCSTRSDCKQKAATLGRHYSVPCDWRLCTLSSSSLVRRVLVVFDLQPRPWPDVVRDLCHRHSVISCVFPSEERGALREHSPSPPRTRLRRSRNDRLQARTPCHAPFGPPRR